MTEAESARSMKRSPSSDWVPWESLRWMTGPRSARSAALLVGSTPATVTNVHSAGQIFSRLLANRRCRRVRLLLRAGVLEQLAQLVLDRLHLADQACAVLVLAEGVPGLEQSLGQREAGGHRTPSVRPAPRSGGGSRA